MIWKGIMNRTKNHPPPSPLPLLKLPVISKYVKTLTRPFQKPQMTIIAINLPIRDVSGFSSIGPASCVASPAAAVDIDGDPNVVDGANALPAALVIIPPGANPAAAGTAVVIVAIAASFRFCDRRAQNITPNINTGTSANGVPKARPNR